MGTLRSAVEGRERSERSFAGVETALSRRPSTTQWPVPLPCKSRGGAKQAEMSNVLCRHGAGIARVRILDEVQFEQPARRDRTAAGAVAAFDRAGRAEAQLLQHPPRRRIVDEMAAMQSLQPKRMASDRDHRLPGLGRIAAAPGIGREPIAQLMALLVRREADSADDARVIAFVAEDQEEGVACLAP